MNRTLSSAVALRASIAILVSILSQAAFGDFSGSDSLESMSPNWKPFESNGGGKLLFRNSRLEYRVSVPTTDDDAAMRWTPNEGAANKDWFVQVAVHLDHFSLKEGADVGLGLAVANPKRPRQRFWITYGRSRSSGEYPIYWNLITAGTDKLIPDKLTIRNEQDIALRIHFDHRAKTLTGSWNPGFGWVFLKPVDISEWGMSDADAFTAILEGSSGRVGRIGPVVPSGDVHFTNFRAGSAKPDIIVSQPLGSDLTDGEKRSFGTVRLGRGRAITYTVRNNGTARLTDLAITRSGPNAADFSVTGPPRVNLKPGESTTFTVRFGPKVAGIRNSVIRIHSNDPNENPFHIRLAGQGVK